MINKKLLATFMQIYTFQPATALWRAVEVDILRNFIPTTGRCLDLGCGDGKLTTIVFENKTDENFILIGVDSDEYETRQAALYPLYRQVHTSMGSHIPEESESFNYVVSNSVLEHIQDLDQTIAEVSRILRPQGKFVFTVPGPNFHTCLYGPLNRQESRENYLKEMDKRLAHYRYLSLTEWASLLSQHGFSIDHQVEYLNREEVQRWENISRFTGGILYKLGRKKHAPITIQKTLGLRKMQNKLTLPYWVANLFAKLLTAGLTEKKNENLNGCILLIAKKK